MSQAGRIPTVFVSSTCYDLSQIRSDIKNFLEDQLGYEALLSEFESFPLNPNISKVENCLRVVRERADVFVLIVGARYGYVTDTGKSITNLEFLEAKTKGIPIYVFIDKKILYYLPIWKANPTGDFSSFVDTTELFKFVESLQNCDNIWIHNFENAGEIISTIKKQLGYLFYDSLLLRQKYTSSNLSTKVQELSGKSLEIATNKPLLWEYKLIGEILKTEYDKVQELKRDFEYGLYFGEKRTYEDLSEFFNWMQLQINNLQGIVDNLNSLIYSALPDAIGAPGEPGDIEIIIYTSQKMIFLYKSIIVWGINLKAVQPSEDEIKLVEVLKSFAEVTIKDCENYFNEYWSMVEKLPASEDSIKEPMEFHLTFTLHSPDLSDYNLEIERLRRKYGLT